MRPGGLDPGTAIEIKRCFVCGGAVSRDVKKTGIIIVKKASANAGQFAPPTAHGPKLRLALSKAHVQEGFLIAKGNILLVVGVV